MAYVPCDWYYENKLGDSCDNKCEECFGNKDVRVCLDDFEVMGETLLDKIKIEKNSWWVCRFENDDHILLFVPYDKSHHLWLKKDLYNKHFKHFIYNGISN